MNSSFGPSVVIGPDIHEKVEKPMLDAHFLLVLYLILALECKMRFIELALNAKLTYFHRTANLNKTEEEKSNGSCWFALAFEIIGLFIVLKLDTAHLKTWMRVEVPWWWFSPAMREELAAHLRVLRVTYCWVILRFTKTTSCYVSTATGKREWCWHVIISWSYTVIGDISPLFKESSCECVSFTTDTKHCYQYFTNCFCEILSQ